MMGVEAEQSVSAGENGIPDRLTRDPRIRAMYKRLLRRRTNGAFVYPARFDLIMAMLGISAEAASKEKMEEELLQKFPIYCLFFGANQAALAPARVILRSDLEQERKELLAAAETIRSSHIAPLERGSFTLSEDESETLLAWRATVKELERKAETLEENCIVVQRNRGSMGDLAVALSIAKWCSILFGTPMYRETATLATVLGYKITPRQVRQWWDDHRERPGCSG